MAYEMKPGEGSVFRNEKKVEDWHPEFRGRVMLPDGVVHWVDVRERVGKDGGSMWLSIRIGKAVVSRHEVEKSNGYQRSGGDDDIPF